EITRAVRRKCRAYRRRKTGSASRSSVQGTRSQTTKKQPRRLFPSEGVFKATDGILNFAFCFVGLAVRLQLGVTDRLADHLLDGAFDLLRRSDEAVLVHDFSPI